MDVQRITGHAPRTVKVSYQIARLQGQCVGCTECKGLCRELIEMMTVPDAVLSRGDDN